MSIKFVARQKIPTSILFARGVEFMIYPFHVCSLETFLRRKFGKLLLEKSFTSLEILSHLNDSREVAGGNIIHHLRVDVFTIFAFFDALIFFIETTRRESAR